MDTARPLDAFPLVRTCSIDELEASLARIYAKPVMELVGRDRALQATQNHCQLQHIGVSYGSYGINARWQFPESNFIAQLFPVRGKGECLIDGASVQIDRDHSVLISANASFRFANDADYERLTLIISPSALTMKLTAIIGQSIHAPLNMSLAQDFKERPARLLRDNFMFLVRQLSSATSLPPLVLAEFEQTLMVMFLHANQHNYSHLLQQEPSDVAPWQVRRAEEYIEANWNKPMSLEAVAAEVGVSIRSLFRNFRQSRGYSAVEFLKQMRLCRARQMLQRPEARITDTDVALVCGFADLDYFIKAYFQAFGERPLETLNRGKGSDFTWH
jgi:AraC-like DNA-binding protein